MNKTEFLKKYPIVDYKIKAVGASLKETLVRINEIDDKYKSDLNEVIKDALIKFKDFFNSEYEAPMPIRQDDIDNFINRKP